MSVPGPPQTDRDALSRYLGTFVNEARLATDVPANPPGDLLRLGHVALTFWNTSA